MAFSDERRAMAFGAGARGQTTLRADSYCGQVEPFCHWCRLSTSMAPRTPDLLPGTLDFLILRTLQRDALHGWAVSERIQHISEDVLQINQGSLYPALHRLEHRGWIEAEWKVSELGRRAKYYRLTTLGRKQLVIETRDWDRMQNAITRVMKLA
jgi:PadR family transcriptional regulator PadR